MNATEHPLRILIADDDAFFRRGLREILNEADGMQVVGEALDGEQAVRMVRQLRPDGLDVALLDLEMPRLDGISTAARLMADDPELWVVMLASTSAAEDELFASVRAGAVGYLNKSLAPETLVRSLQAFSHGESVPIARADAQKLLRRLRQEPVVAPSEVAPARANLTSRELEVLELIGHGSRDREIAERLVVGHSTVKKHVQNILRKLHARNRAEAVAQMRAGYTSGPNARTSAEVERPGTSGTNSTRAPTSRAVAASGRSPAE